MSKLDSRLGRLERTLGGGQCIACADMPKVVRIDTADDDSELERCLRWHREHCTCGRTLHVKRIIVRYGSGISLPPAVRGTG